MKIETNIVINTNKTVNENPVFTNLLIFLFYLYKIKSVNNFVKTGFSLTVLFVFITILVSIFTLNYYDKSLVEVDFLHGFAESFLTLSDFVILFGFIKLLNSLEVNNS